MSLLNPLNRLDVYSWIILALLVFAAAGAYTYGPSQTLPQVLIAVAAANAFDMAAKYIKTRKIVFTKSATITGLFIGLLLGLSSEYYLPVAAAAVAIASKHLINVKGRHVFNPALLSMLFLWVAFSALPAWWGSFAFPTQQFPWLNLLVVAALGVVIMVRQKRYDLVLPFVGAFMLLSFVTNTLLAGSLLVPIIDSTTLFAAMFMLVEPKTSPLFSRARIFYGVVAATLFVGFALLRIENAPLFALLAANLFVLPLDKYLRG